MALTTNTRYAGFSKVLEQAPLCKRLCSSLGAAMFVIGQHLCFQSQRARHPFLLRLEETSETKVRSSTAELAAGGFKPGFKPLSARLIPPARVAKSRCDANVRQYALTTHYCQHSQLASSQTSEQVQQKVCLRTKSAKYYMQSWAT